MCFGMHNKRAINLLYKYIPPKQTIAVMYAAPSAKAIQNNPIIGFGPPPRAYAKVGMKIAIRKSRIRLMKFIFNLK